MPSRAGARRSQTLPLCNYPPQVLHGSPSFAVHGFPLLKNLQELLCRFPEFERLYAAVGTTLCCACSELCAVATGRCGFAACGGLAGCASIFFSSSSSRALSLEMDWSSLSNFVESEIRTSASSVSESEGLMVFALSAHCTVASAKMKRETVRNFMSLIYLIAINYHINSQLVK